MAERLLAPGLDLTVYDVADAAVAHSAVRLESPRQSLMSVRCGRSDRRLRAR